MSEAIPNVGRERLPSLDLVRGVAVLAILLANIPAFSASSDTTIAQPPSSWSDQLVVAATLFFIDGKFITLFSILFGAGLTIQLDRAAAEGRPFVGYYLRRQGVLLFIGVAHMLLLWFGDILTAYAIVGGFALLALRSSPTVIRWTAAVSLLWTCLVILLLIFGCAVLLTIPADSEWGRQLTKMGQQSPPPPENDPLGVQRFFHDQFGPEGQTAIYQRGTFGAMVFNRFLYLIAFIVQLPMVLGWYLFGCFLLGGMLLRSGVFHDPDRHPALIGRLILFGLAVGLPLQIGAVAAYLVGQSHQTTGMNLWGGLAGLLGYLGALPMALAYLGLMVRWSTSGFLTTIQSRLRDVGRMALTNYLMQSVLCGLLFYSYGFGWFGRVTPTQAFFIVIAVWMLELAWSPLWLHFFTMGPVEWFWRSLTDGKMRPLLRRAATP